MSSCMCLSDGLKVLLFLWVLSKYLYCIVINVQCPWLSIMPVNPALVPPGELRKQVGCPSWDAVHTPARSRTCEKLEVCQGQQEFTPPFTKQAPVPLSDKSLISSGFYFLTGRKRKKGFYTLPSPHALRWKCRLKLILIASFFHVSSCRAWWEDVQGRETTFSVDDN